MVNVNTLMLADHPVLKIVYLTECKCTVLSVRVRWGRCEGEVYSEGVGRDGMDVSLYLCTAKVSIAWFHLSWWVTQGH